MSNESPTDSSNVASSQSSARQSCDAALLRLLAAAAATLSNDRARAQTCVQQAAELLRVSLEREGSLPNESSFRGGLAPWQEKRVVDYIESNIGVRLRVPVLARVAQLSIGYFFRAFSVSFGQTPLAYVKARRIRHAQVMMLSTAEPLSQIALACGMYDQAHFSRVFRKQVGITPSLWRRQLQSESISIDDLLRSASHRVSQPQTTGQPARRDAVNTGASLPRD